MNHAMKELDQGIVDLRAGMPVDALAHLEEARKYLDWAITARKRVADEDAKWCRTEYGKDVEDLAKGAYDSNDEDEHITNEVGGSGWLTSDRGVYAVMEHTDYPDEAMGSGHSTFRDCIEASAEYAMAADVRKCLADNRADWDEENAEDEEDEEDEDV